MVPVRLWLAAALLAVLPAACGLEETGLAGAADAGSDDGANGGSGGIVIGGGTCFPGSKVCPNAKGELVCLDSNDPQTGCKGTAACEPCVVVNAVPSCNSNGQCVAEECQTGWAECNGDPTDGCETFLEKDPSHCGSCVNDCLATGPGYLCKAGVCVENTCSPTTTADCDNDPNTGCEVDLTTDSNNCSFCGNVCKLPHATATCQPEPSGNPLARCVIQACDAGWADCDGNPANGCESNPTTDPNNCGGCGTKCDATNGTPGCSGGKCGIVCFGGFGDCNGNPADGCEVGLKYDAANCSACGNVCPSAGGVPACTNGVCGIGTCPSGFGECDNNAANGCETNITSDPANCGGCGKPCPAVANGTPSCSAGTCGTTCNSGFALCGGSTCIDVTSDPSHCGSTCAVCPPPGNGNGNASCEQGNCKITCKGGLQACGATCVDLMTDKSHCGNCSTVCNDPSGGTSACVSGVCKATCGGGLTACGNSCVNLSNDKDNCGSCGKGCAWNRYCSGSACVCYVGHDCPVFGCCL
jgi:hypothetical protein